MSRQRGVVSRVHNLTGTVHGLGDVASVRLFFLPTRAQQGSTDLEVPAAQSRFLYYEGWSQPGGRGSLTMTGVLELGETEQPIGVMFGQAQAILESVSPPAGSVLDPPEG